MVFTRVDSVLKGHRVFTQAMLAMGVVTVHLVWCGDIDGSFALHFLVLQYAIVTQALWLLERLGVTRPHQQIVLQVTMMKLAKAGYGSLCFLMPSCTLFDQLIFAITVPISDCLLVMLMLYSSTELTSSMRLHPAFGYLEYLPPLCSVVRAAVLDVDPKNTFAAMPILLIASTIHVSKVKQVVDLVEVNFSQLRSSVRDEVTRTMSALTKLEHSNADLENVSHGMSRMLKALCDVVVYLDGDLQIQNPSGQLLNALGQQSDQVEGRPFLDFVQRPEDHDLIYNNLSVAASSSDSESESRQQSGPAGAFRITLQHAGGDGFDVQVFYVRMGAAGGPAFLLGLQVHEVERPAPPSEPGDDDQRERPAMDMLTAQAPGAARAPSASPEAEANQSRIAINFDATSDEFTILGHNPLSAAPKELSVRPQHLLRWLGVEQREAFESWVLSNVQAAPWDKVITSEPFEAPMNLTLPRVHARDARVAKAWLEIAPPDEDGDIEATLWLEGISLERSRRRLHLATVHEMPGEGDDGASDDASTASSSSTSSFFSAAVP